jgi:hypothetical protein
VTSCKYCSRSCTACLLFFLNLCQTWRGRWVGIDVSATAYTNVTPGELEAPPAAGGGDGGGEGDRGPAMGRDVPGRAKVGGLAAVL